MVAVDAVTGKYKWHFQTIHHDLWDSDLPPAPSLIDIVKDGKKIPALAQIGKAGWMFILDRTNGKTGIRRRRASGSQRRCAWRMVFAHATVSAETAGACASQLQSGRYCDCR